MGTRGKVPVLLFLFLVAVTPAISWSQTFHSEAKGKVCVAMVANISTGNAVVERLTARLSNNLRDGEIDAVTMESSTTTAQKLQPTGENREEAKTKECGYILLTQIVNRKVGSPEPPSVGISIGRTGPGLDASDPARSSPLPVHRDDLQIWFALFRTGPPKSVLHSQITAKPSGQGPESLTPAVDRESSLVAAELKRK